jgi:tRNA 2-thiouridine synthesizing protein E
MPIRELAGCRVEVNDEGFLRDSAQWTPAVGEALAREAGLEPLNDRHWQVITFCREDAARAGRSPGLRRIAKLSGVPTPELYNLFPKGPGQQAALIAGLPKPRTRVRPRARRRTT